MMKHYSVMHMKIFNILRIYYEMRLTGLPLIWLGKRFTFIQLEQTIKKQIREQNNNN